MYFTSIHSNDSFEHYPKAIRRAIDYLKSHDFSAMEAGVYEIEGKQLYAQVIDTETTPKEEKRPESHEKYLDVQFLAQGKELIGCTPNTGNYEIAEKLQDKDLIFYTAVENETFLVMRPGSVAVLFPHDIHRPACADGTPAKIRKIVVKVSVELL